MFHIIARVFYKNTGYLIGIIKYTLYIFNNILEFKEIMSNKM